MPELSESRAKTLIRQGLKDRDWRPAGIETLLQAVENIDGFWSYGTVTGIKDLAEIFEEIQAEHGEPPDRTM